ncbi:MAG: phenylalanine--tRNA ligase subunit beta [Patescibacteria group bacterium]
MQILIPDSWLREYLDTEATPKQIQHALSLCGPSVERLHKKGDEYIYDIEVTTNRVDMMSVVGIAFECVAILPQFGHKARLKKDPYLEKVKLVTSKKVDYLTVTLDKSLCYRFSTALIKNVKVGKSLEWLVTRLELVGMRSLNNVVDISNYLMHELGQPVHTFDYDKIIDHKMIVRESRKGEKLITLDNKSHTLPGGDIVIEDGSGKLIDLCGIMGGLNSAVDDQTSNVLLFVQTYEPSHIRKTSMSLSHRTSAAELFEKNLPTENVLPTLESGMKLFDQLTGGHADKTVLDILNISEGPTVLKLSSPLTEFVNKRLGINLSFSEISKILKSLEFVVKSEQIIEIPWVRKIDVTIPEDLVEEVARIYGYHNLPTQLMSGYLPAPTGDKTFYWEAKIKSALSHWGFTETYTYSLVDKDSGLKLKNPLSSEWEYLRTTLTPSHLKTISENLGRVGDLHLFEIANVYLPKKDNLPHEELHLILSTTNLDVSRLKGYIESLGLEMGVAISPQIQNHTIAITCEINLEPLITKASGVKTFTPISKFSPIIEDVNVVYTGNYAATVEKIKKVSPLIKNIELIDKYENKLTLRIIYHDDTKQLSSSDIAPIRTRLTLLSG